MDTAAAVVENDPVNHPSHYTSHPSGYECIQIVRLLSFDAGNCVKYVWRRADKDSPRQDLEKSLFYLRDAVTLAADSLWVPERAAVMLREVADADPDPVAAEFYRSVADTRWREAEHAIGILIDQLPVEPS